jgi:hypothetical protein
MLKASEAGFRIARHSKILVSFTDPSAKAETIGLETGGTVL